MAILSDNIEEFIVALLSDAENMVEVRRNELAQYFKCAPSQINYVLSTRFTLERGYMIESRKGGGGYIRITRVQADAQDMLFYLATQGIGEALSAREAAQAVDALAHNKILTGREAYIMRHALSDKAIQLPESIRARLRADMLKQMLIGCMQAGENLVIEGSDSV